MKKSTSGKPYVKPSGRPTFTFHKQDTIVEVFETMTNVEIFQRSSTSQEQRMVMTPSAFDNFYNTLKSNGFAVQ